jgi:carbamoylphosphate synthase large subunit
MYQINKKQLTEIVYPCIFKLAITYNGNGSYICNNKLQLQELELRNRNYFIQEFISGKIEYAGHFFVLNGNIKYSTCYQATYNSHDYIQTHRIKNYKKIPNFNFTSISQIFTILNYTGFACIDFKIVDDKIKIFEINPRMGGSIVHDKEDFHNIILSMKYSIFKQ